MTVNVSEESFDLLKMDRTIVRRARTSRLLRVALWGGLLAFGLKQRGAAGLVATAVSLERLYRLFAPEARGRLQGLPNQQLRSSSRPSQSNRDWDRVDQAAWESFPASDPPGRM